MDLHDPMVNLSTESCERGFLQSFREQMRDFHDLSKAEAIPSVHIFLG